MYNRNPAVFINVKINTFITDITKEIQEIAWKLDRIRNREQDKSELIRKFDNPN